MIKRGWAEVRESVIGETTKDGFEGWMEFHQMKDEKGGSGKQVAWAKG